MEARWKSTPAHLDAASAPRAFRRLWRPGTPSEGWIYLFFESEGQGKVARFNLSWLRGGEETGDGNPPENLR